MIKGRIAPTPSGFLHLGNAYSFLFTFLLISKHKGELRLRIDDHDGLRTKQSFIDDLFYALDWLGIYWQLGPQNAGEAFTYSQGQRLEIYQHYIELLKNDGRLFACTCSRKSIGDYPNYPGVCIGKQLPLKDGCNWRLLPSTTTQFFFDHFTQKQVSLTLGNTLTHPVIKRKDGLPAYQLISLIDDVDYGINCIVRGEDLLASTCFQLFLSHQLQLKSFIHTKFYHHPLLVNEQGNKLSKSAGSFSLADFKQHYTITELYQGFAAWIGIINAKEITSLNDLMYCFNTLDY
ncbi:MAG: hypothetical protein EAY81_02915 [Bacteroidetes bacterium]|nr:MAG: hypothetical protein EAY81_02915 [Bacteroidota bacterium]